MAGLALLLCDNTLFQDRLNALQEDGAGSAARGKDVIMSAISALAAAQPPAFTHTLSHPPWMHFEDH